MENEITSPRAGHRLRALRRAGPAGHDRPGHLPGHAGRRLTEPHAPFCADLSRENDEPLAATASRIDHWFLVEYRGLWARDALTGSGLSDQVKQHLLDQVRVGPARPAPVRQAPRSQRATRAPRVHGRLEAGSRPTVTRTEFEAYEDLRGLDLLAGTAVEHPLFLVCTHGKHDPCCARFGRPLYEALRDELAPDWVWQVVAHRRRPVRGQPRLPAGGALLRASRPRDGRPVLDEHLARRILIPSYRGRSIYTFAVQAAERVVRERTGLVGIDDLTLREVVRRNDDRLASPLPPARRHTSCGSTRSADDLTRLTCSSESLERPPRFVVSPA